MRLRKPDPDFAYKLSPAVRVPRAPRRPPDTPAGRRGRHGPVRDRQLRRPPPTRASSFGGIRTFASGRQPRSPAAIPTGSSDLRQRTRPSGDGDRAGERRPMQTPLPPDGGRRSRLATRPRCTSSVAATVAFFLNTRVPPFNNLEARQALSYAIDRSKAWPPTAESSRDRHVSDPAGRIPVTGPTVRSRTDRQRNLDRPDLARARSSSPLRAPGARGSSSRPARGRFWPHGEAVATLGGSAITRR